MPLVSQYSVAATTKRLQLLHDVVPQAAVIAFLRNPNNPFGNIEMAAAKTAATSLGRQVVVLDASNESELDAAFASMKQHTIGYLQSTTYASLLRQVV